MSLNLVALDVATRLTGYAVFSSREGKVYLKRFGLIKGDAREPWDIRSMEMTGKFRSIIVENKCTACALEFPQFQAGSRGTHAARQGDTLKLAYLCGCFATAWQLHIAAIMRGMKETVPLPLAQLITPVQWKGQCSKEITAKRCLEKYGVRAMTDREYNYSDAIMMGDHWIGLNNLERIEYRRGERMDI